MQTIEVNARASHRIVLWAENSIQNRIKGMKVKSTIVWIIVLCIAAAFVAAVALNVDTAPAELLPAL